MDDLISRSALIEAIKTIKKECKEHLMCRDCPIYSNDKGCLIEPVPCDWEIRDNEDCVELYEKERETMIKYEDECCGCAVPAYPCMGSACPNRNVPHFYCDECKEDVEELFKWDDKQLCIDCIKKKLEKIEPE